MKYIVYILMCTHITQVLCMQSPVLSASTLLPSPHKTGITISLACSTLYELSAQQAVPGSPTAQYHSQMGKRLQALANAHKNADLTQQQLENPQLTSNAVARRMLKERLAIYEWLHTQILQDIQEQESPE